MGSTVAKCRSHKDKGYTQRWKRSKTIENWRPIILLNTVYEITSSFIAARLKTVLPKVISDDQKGFWKGRYIGETIRL